MTRRKTAIHKVYAYRWGITSGRWQDNRAPTASDALLALMDSARRRFQKEDGWTLGTEGPRAPAYAKQIRSGDVVLFCATNKFARPGVYGISIVTEEPFGPGWGLNVDGLPICDELAFNPIGPESVQTNVYAPQGVASTLLRIDNPPRALKQLISGALAGQNTNRIGLTDRPSAIEPEQILSEEGKRVFREQQRVERKARNRKMVLAAYDLPYECEACAESSAATYGVDYAELIHVHHLKPIGAAKKSYVPRVKDFALLCPTCHAVAHWEKPLRPMAPKEIRKLIRRRG